MSASVELIDYESVRKQIGSERSHLLLGNGFSIACDPVFRYQTLYDVAVAAGLSSKAQAAFERLGTNNFEAVLRLLEDSHWLCRIYGIEDAKAEDMLRDVEVVKNALVTAVTRSHVAHSGLISEENKYAAREFLSSFHNIFTTNYDLLLYWAVLSQPNARHGDGFRSDEGDPEAPYVVFAERLGRDRGIFYLHGALHIYVKGGQLRKHTWNRTGQHLTGQIRASLDVGEYPLIVAEGTPQKKLEQIERNGYLWYALDKLHRIEKSLVIYGHSLGASDKHIADAIVSADRLNRIFVGLHGDPDSEGNMAIRAAVSRMKSARAQRSEKKPKIQPLDVLYYDSASARPWNT
jgi:hypothetical protein